MLQAHREERTITSVARTLGIAKKTLWEKRKRYNIDRRLKRCLQNSS